MSNFDPSSSFAGTVLDGDTTPGTDQTVARGDDLVGHIFVGRYQIEKQVASGTMGRVYLGTQLRLERPVAIKILKQWGNAIDPRFAKRFCREASIASQLAHPNIVSIYDYGETDDRRLFMVMEYLEGIPLHELIRAEAPFTPERALSIVIQIARALRRAHGAGVVHRDLKPANVVVKTDEEGFDFVKVLDFGLVKLFAPEESPVTAPDDEDHLTRPGNMVGTPDYVSPEQALGDEVDGRTDIYSLGVLLFQMIAGRLPFIGASIIEMVKHHLNSPVPFVSEVSPGVECPAEIEEIIQRSMCKVRDDRYDSMDQLLVALKSAWRNVTDESFGTEVSQAQLLPASLPSAVSAPDVAAFGRNAALDPSEVSRPAGGSFFAPPSVAPRPARSRMWVGLAAAGLLGIAGFSGAYFYRSFMRPTIMVVTDSAPALAPVAKEEAALPEGDAPPVVSPPVVLANEKKELAAPDTVSGVPDTVSVAPSVAPEPVNARKKASAKRGKKAPARIYKDNPF